MRARKVVGGERSAGETYSFDGGVKTRAQALPRIRIAAHGESDSSVFV